MKLLAQVRGVLRTKRYSPTGPGCCCSSVYGCGWRTWTPGAGRGWGCEAQPISC